MTTKTLEAVARAICAAQGHDPDLITKTGDDDFPLRGYMFFSKHAEAALQALSENISEEMVDAGIRDQVIRSTLVSRVKHPFKAMIQAAIGEKE